MKKLSLLVVLSLCAAAQESAPAEKPRKAKSLPEVQDVNVTKMLAAQLAPQTSAPERVVAVVNGVKITAGELFRFYGTLPSNMQFYYGQNRKEFVERYAVMRKLAAAALTKKLDQREPYKFQLDNARQNILMQASMDDFSGKIVVAEEDQKKYYTEHQKEYTQVGISGIFIGGFNNNSERAADIVKKLKAGGDFAKLAKEFSTDRTSAERDGQIGYLDANGNYPAEAMKAILALKAGEISEPVPLDNGFWIFRLEEVRTKDFLAVREQILQTMKQQRLLDWVEQSRKAMTMKVQDESYFKVELPKLPEAEAPPAAK